MQKKKIFVPAYLTTTFNFLLYSYENLLIKIYVFRISVLDINLYESFSVLSSNIHNLLFKLLFLFYFSLILINNTYKTCLKIFEKCVRLMNGLLVNNCTCYYLINVALKQRLLLIYVLLQYAVYHLQA